VLVANRGEIAVRVIRTCRDLGIDTVAVFSEPDATALHVRVADSAVPLTGRTAVETYLDVPAVLQALAASGADAVHPGYGFLAEDATFAAEVLAAGATWIGPPPSAIAAMGDKIASRLTAETAAVAAVPGTRTAVADEAEVRAFAAVNGYPVAIKAARGGGGRGLRVVAGDDDAPEALEAARREAAAAFGDGTCYVERYLAWPRHVEVQVLADAHGAAMALGDRDCSSQRRHQKLIEESPAPDLPDAVRHGLADAAVRMAVAVGYQGAGTVEFLVEGDGFWFLEMNTRLQVEHPVTELVHGLDLVAAQLQLADGVPLERVVAGLEPSGHAIEVRVNAEDPTAGRFLPSPGTITRMVTPGGFGTRFDAGYESGDTIPQFYDNLIGKLVVWAPDRDAAIRRARRALDEIVIEGVATTVPAAALILAHPDFAGVRHSTRWVEERLDFSALAVTSAPASVDASLDMGSDDLRDEVHVNGRWYRVPYAAAGSALTGNGPSGEARIATRSPSTRDHSPRERRAGHQHGAGGDGSGRIVAPMQGTVVRVLVAEGDEVTVGDTVLVLEAMKMENRLLAERDGTVSAVRAVAGETVAPGDVLVELS
jgi:acetyl-CoA/propionyl-CoA carboxylase biotin carboxyl carrier protein